MKPHGRLLLTIRDEGGRIVATRAAKNGVLRGGAEVIASLFAGARNTPIDRVRLGFGQASIDPTASALTPPVEAIPAERLEAALKPEHFTVRAGDDRVTVDVAAPFAGDGPVLVAGYSFGALVGLNVTDPRVTGWLAVAPPLPTADAAPLERGGHDGVRKDDALAGYAVLGKGHLVAQFGFEAVGLAVVLDGDRLVAAHGMRT